MASEIGDGDQLLQTGAFSNWTSINEQHITADGVLKYFPSNATHVQITQTLATVDVTNNTSMYLPHPLRINDGQSKMWFVFWDLSGVNVNRDCTLTLINPAAISTPAYNYPASDINGAASNLVISRMGQTGSDHRNKIGYIIWCTSDNHYFVATMGDPTTFGTITAGPGAYDQPSSAPSVAGSVWSINAFAGENVTFVGTVTNDNDSAVGPVGFNTTPASAGYWLVSQPGKISQLRFKCNAAGTLAGNVTLTDGTETIIIAAGGANSGENITDSITVVAGNTVQILLSAPGASAGITSFAFVFRPSAV